MVFNRKREIKTRSQSGGVHRTVDGSHQTIRDLNVVKLLQGIQATGVYSFIPRLSNPVRAKVPKDRVRWNFRGGMDVTVGCFAL